MANNFIEGPHLCIQAKNATGVDVVSGQPFVAGDTVGVATVNIADTETGSVAIQGVVMLPKAAGIALISGVKVNLAAGEITSGAGAAAGVCSRVADAGDATVEIALNINTGV